MDILQEKQGHQSGREAGEFLHGPATFGIEVGQHAGDPGQHRRNGGLHKGEPEQEHGSAAVCDSEESTDADMFTVTGHC